jgi:hypothetical protein
MFMCLNLHTIMCNLICLHSSLSRLLEITFVCHCDVEEDEEVIEKKCYATVYLTLNKILKKVNE